MSNQCPLWSSSVSCSCFYFILFADSENTHVCLEYFDSEKKWGNGGKKVTFKFPLQQFSKCYQQIFSVSRSIVIKSCFNINRRTEISSLWWPSTPTKTVFQLPLNLRTNCLGGSSPFSDFSWSIESQKEKS